MNESSQINYASEWNAVYALDKDPIRKYLIYPFLETWIHDLSDCNILDIGGGNGTLFTQLRKHNYRRGLVVDINEEFLSFGKEYLNERRVKFLKADIAEGIPAQSHSIDIAFSIFVLNEIENIGSVFSELHRVLRKDGRAIIVVTHPFFVLYWTLKSKWEGEENKKVLGNTGYFDRRMACYVFTIASTSAPYYQHTFADYINEINTAGLFISKMEELCTDRDQFREISTYWDTRDIPKFLVLELRCQ